MSRTVLALLAAAIVASGCAGGDPTVDGGDPPACTPSCEGRACGGDGCGGSCGACAAGTSCDASFACVADEVPACPGGGACALTVYRAYLYDCTRASTTTPWSCAAILPDGDFATRVECEMRCTDGQSACHEGDTDVGAECRACLASCATPVKELCFGAAPGTCPAPCACG